MTEPRYPRYGIYKLTDPRGQVGMPGTHKWAVGVQHVAGQGFGFEDAFRTKRGAQDYIWKTHHACTLCGEVLAATHPVCECERKAAEPI